MSGSTDYYLELINDHLSRIADALEKMPCPTPSGASADTGVNGAGSMDSTSRGGQATNAPSSGSSTDADPPPTEEPETIARLREIVAEDAKCKRVTVFYGCVTPAAFLAAYDAERAARVRAERSARQWEELLRSERINVDSARGRCEAHQNRLLKIAATLSDNSLERSQKIGRALRVAEGRQ